MTDVLISYSRRNDDFAKKLAEALLAAKREVWADWASIPAASEWEAEIKEGIVKSDAVLFVLSPEWIESPECRKELTQALKMGKRLIPILHIMPAQGQQVPPELAKLNWVYMQEKDDFDKAFLILLDALDTELDWVKTHTRILERAVEWDTKERDTSFTLHGKDLTAGEKFIASASGKSPEPTHLQGEYIVASRKDATYKQNLTIAGISVALAVSIALGVMAFLQKQEADRQANISRAGELAGLSSSVKGDQFDLGLLFAVEGFHKYNDSLTQGTLYTINNSHPEIEKILPGHTALVTSVAFSPDGKYLASGSEDNSIILWDMNNPDDPVQLPSLQRHHAGVTSIAFSPDGKWLASGSEDRTIILWDISNPARPSPLSILAGHSNMVTSVAFSPDGKYLASGGWDASVILWDISNPSKPSPLPTLTEHTAAVTSVAFSPDGKYLASGSWDASVILWDISNPTRPSPLTTLTGHTAAVTSVAFSPDGKYLASGSEDKITMLWNISDLSKEPTKLTRHSATVTNLAFSPDGTRWASSSEDKSITLWDVNNPGASPTVLTGQGVISSVVFSSDGKHLASGGWDSTVVWWNIGNPKASLQLATLPGSLDTKYQLGGINNIALSSENELLALGTRDTSADKARVILWDISDPNNPKLFDILKIDGVSVYTVAFGPDGKYLASGGWGIPLNLWDINDLTAVPVTLEGHTGPVTSLTFSPDGNLLVSGSEDQTLILWDISKPKDPVRLAQLSGHSAVINSVAFSPDGKTVASGSKDNSIILWDVSQHTNPFKLATLNGANGLAGINSVAFNKNGNLLASGNNNGTITLWDISNLKKPTRLTTLYGHNGAVYSLAFSPDNEHLASSSEDKSIILWDISTTKTASPISVLSGHSQAVKSVAFNSDGKILASGSDDTTTRLWDTDIQSWVDKVCQRAGRNFTRTEWEQYFVRENYRQTCKQWSEMPDPALPPPLLMRDVTGFTVNGVTLKDAGTSVTVAPGTELTIKYNFQVYNLPSCRTCETQLVTGLWDPNHTHSTSCAYDGGPPLFPGTTGAENTTITAPQTPGTYPVVVEYNWQNNCGDALAKYGTGKFALSPQVIGKITVSNTP